MRLSKKELAQRLHETEVSLDFSAEIVRKLEAERDEARAERDDLARILADWVRRDPDGYTVSSSASDTNVFTDCWISGATGETEGER